MRRSMSRPMLLMFGLLVTLSSPQALPAQIDNIVYFGGGLQLGYVFGEGPSFGAEVTFGIFAPGNLPIASSIALGMHVNPAEPQSLTYVSWSVSAAGLLGISIGKTFYLLDGRNYEGTRHSVYGVLPLPIPLGNNLLTSAMVSLEYYRYPNLDTSSWLIGMWGRFAVLLSDFHYT